MQFCSRSETSKSLLGQSNHCLADIDPNIACIRRKVFFKKSLRESARATTEFQNAVCPIELPIPDESLSRHPHRSLGNPVSCRSDRKTSWLADKIISEAPLVPTLSSVPTLNKDQPRAVRDHRLAPRIYPVPRSLSSCH